MPQQPGWTRPRVISIPEPYNGLLVAILTASAALGLALLVASAFNDAPVPIFLAGVLVSAWLRGYWPGLLTTALSTVGLVRYFDLSRASPLPQTADTAFDLALFVAVACLINWLTARLRVTVMHLQAARDKIDATMRARDAFVAAAAHDLKSPLAGISMAAQLARHRIDGSMLDQATVDQVACALADIESDAQRIAGLLDELLDLSQLEAGRALRMVRARTRLLDLVEPLATAHQCSTPTHRIDVVALADPVGMWDARRLRRVLDNLLSNAVKYSPCGGEITVTVSGEPAAGGNRTASVRVRDRGLGIPASDMRHLFERYFRGHNVSDIAGTGVGLAGARAIVEQHGGTLCAESQEGAGSTFILELPLEMPGPS